MSMCVWAGYRLEDGTHVYDEHDKYMLLQYSEELDEVCEAMSIIPISEMIDGTEYEEDFLMDAGQELSEDEYEEFVAQSSQQTEINPRDAIHTFDALLVALAEDPALISATDDETQVLKQELSSCLGTAQAALEQNAAFKLLLQL